MKFKQATWNFTKNLTLKPILLEAVVSLSHFCHSWSKLPLSQRQKSAKICKNANFMYTGISEFFFSFVLVNDEAVHILSEKDNISNLLCEQCYHIFFYCFLSTLNMKIVLWNYPYHFNWRRYGTNGSLQHHLMSRNRWSSIVYRRGQKQLTRMFLKEAEHALQLALSEGN